MTITPIYASLIALIFIMLSIRVISFRRANAVSLGDGGNPELLKRIRAQGNCAEYAPIALLLLLTAEMQTTPNFWLHLIGASLLFGRMLHGVALSQPKPFILGRVGGMTFTLAAIGIGIAINLYQILV